eukprot:gene29122-32340_t
MVPSRGSGPESPGQATAIQPDLAHLAPASSHQLLSVHAGGQRSVVASPRAKSTTGDAVVVVGDIGGTNARLSVWMTGSETTEIFSKTYPTANHPTFECVMDELLAEPAVQAHKPQAAALAIAGAVEDNYCSMTNLDWVVDGAALQKKFGFRVALLNDFEAVGYGIPVLAEEDVMVVNAATCKEQVDASQTKSTDLRSPSLATQGPIFAANSATPDGCTVCDPPRWRPCGHGPGTDLGAASDDAPKVVMGPGTGMGAAQLMWAPKVVMGPGTGLGAAQLMWDSGSASYKAPKVVMGPGTGLGAAQLMWDSGSASYKVWPGEGSHGTFAPRGWKQLALHDFATKKLGHVEVEQVACGSGLELIYEFLISDEVANRPMLLKAAKPKAAADVSASALDGSDRIAVEAIDMFLAIVGAEAGSMALRSLAKGGVYIAGGITPKLLAREDARVGLLEGYQNPKLRSVFHDILCSIPLYVITNDKVGQIGAREYARSLLD